MSRVILVDPRGWQGAASGYGPAPNIGIAYLVAALRRDGHEPLVLDLNNAKYTDEECLAAAGDFRPDLIGFSVKTATVGSALSLARKLKDCLPGTPIAFGGPHATLTRGDALANPAVDAVFVGEGERSLPEALARLSRGASIAELPGVLTRDAPPQTLVPGHPLLAPAELDDLPFPAYDLFPVSVRQSLRESYPLVTSRGCPHQCTYCSVPLVSGRGFRRRSPASVIEELRHARSEHATVEFVLIDDSFNLDMRRAKEICRALIDSGMGMRWNCANGLRADRIDRELAGLMRDSGCHSAMVGIESADPSVLAAAQKGETIEEIERGIVLLQEAGIRVGGYFIIGLPGDSFEAEKLSVGFAKRMGINAHFNMLVPYPGTALWTWVHSHARFLRAPENALHFADSVDRIQSVFETDDLTAAERRRAYEMVYTKLGRFDMLTPAGASRRQALTTRFRLLWRYDRARIPRDVLELCRRRWRRPSPS